MVPIHTQGNADTLWALLVTKTSPPRLWAWWWSLVNHMLIHSPKVWLPFLFLPGLVGSPTCCCQSSTRKESQQTGTPPSPRNTQHSGHSETIHIGPLPLEELPQ